MKIYNYEVNEDNVDNVIRSLLTQVLECCETAKVIFERHDDYDEFNIYEFIIVIEALEKKNNIAHAIDDVYEYVKEHNVYINDDHIRFCEFNRSKLEDLFTDLVHMFAEYNDKYRVVYNYKTNITMVDEKKGE